MGKTNKTEFGDPSTSPLWWGDAAFSGSKRKIVGVAKVRKMARNLTHLDPCRKLCSNYRLPAAKPCEQACELRPVDFLQAEHSKPLLSGLVGTTDLIVAG